MPFFDTGIDLFALDIDLPGGQAQIAGNGGFHFFQNPPGVKFGCLALRGLQGLGQGLEQLGGETHGQVHVAGKPLQDEGRGEEDRRSRGWVLWCGLRAGVDGWPSQGIDGNGQTVGSQATAQAVQIGRVDLAAGGGEGVAQKAADVVSRRVAWRTCTCWPAAAQARNWLVWRWLGGRPRD